MTVPDLEIRTFELPRQLEALAPFAADWDRLVEEDGGAHPSSSFAWTRSFFEHLVPGETRATCLVALRGGALVGVLPLLIEDHPLFGRSARTLRMPNHDHFPSGDAVLAGEGQGEIFRALVNHAIAHQRGAICVGFSHVTSRSITHRIAPATFPLPRLTVESDGFGSFVPIRGSTLAEFRERLSKNFSSNLRKFHNKLKKSENRVFEFQIGEAADPSFLPTFMELEGSGWKGKESTAIVSSPQLRAFYQDFVARLHARGWLQWNLLRVGDRVIAAHLGIRVGRRLFLWKVAYDEAFSAYAPGNLLFETLVENEFQRNELDEINYMTKTSFTNNWRLLPFDYYNMRVYAFGARSLMLGAAPDWGKQLLRRARRWVKR